MSGQATRCSFTTPTGRWCVLVANHDGEHEFDHRVNAPSSREEPIGCRCVDTCRGRATMTRVANRGDGWRLRRWVNTPERDEGPWVWKAIWEWRSYLVRPHATGARMSDLDGVCGVCGKPRAVCRLDAQATGTRAAQEVYVVIVGYDVEDVRVFSAKQAAERFQTSDMANHSAPFAAVIEDGRE